MNGLVVCHVTNVTPPINNSIGDIDTKNNGLQANNALLSNALVQVNLSYLYLYHTLPPLSLWQQQRPAVFYLSEYVHMTASSADGSRFVAEVDLSAYVNVPTGQAIAIDSVDFIWQNGTNYDGNVEAMVAANGSLSVQLTDLKPRKCIH